MTWTSYDPRGTFDATGGSRPRRADYSDLLSYEAEIAVDIDQNVPTDAETAVYFTSEEYKLRGKIANDFDIQSEEIDGDVNARTTHHIPFEGSPDASGSSDTPRSSANTATTSCAI